MGALALCGVPDEKYWPYTDAKPDFDKEPASFVYAVADNYEALRYFCHDPLGANVPGSAVLTNVKNGIPYPCPGERAQWGHAIVAVGYDDGKKIKNTKCNKTTTGALLIRNSWGTRWGEHGYGWLPYDYVVSKLALDFWSLLCMEWIDTKQFGV
jgi:C1A family cysteine protease